MKTSSVPQNLHSKLTAYVRQRAGETFASGNRKVFTQYRNAAQKINAKDEQNSAMFNHIGLMNEYVSRCFLG